MKIVGLGGAYSSDSSSLSSLKICLRKMESLGYETSVLNIVELDLPFFDFNLNSIPLDAQRLVDEIKNCDGMIWSSPLYHGSISGAFKNAVDWIELLSNENPPYLSNKFVGLISTAGGNQGIQAINSMEYMVRALRGYTLPYVVPIARSYEVFEKDGTLKDNEVKQQIEQLAVVMAETLSKLSTR